MQDSGSHQTIELFENIKRMWREIVIRPAPVDHPAVSNLLTELRQLYAGVEFGRFILSDDPLYRASTGGSGFDSIDFFRGFVSTEAFKTSMPALGECIFGPYSWRPREESPLMLDGLLAAMLVSGGAYRNFAGTQWEAKRLAVDYCDALFGYRYEDIQIYYSGDAWSKWFHNVAWDNTIIGIDSFDESLWMLCVTDTD